MVMNMPINIPTNIVDSDAALFASIRQEEFFINFSSISVLLNAPMGEHVALKVFCNKNLNELSSC